MFVKNYLEYYQLFKTHIETLQSVQSIMFYMYLQGILVKALYCLAAAFAVTLVVLQVKVFKYSNKIYMFSKLVGMDVEFKERIDNFFSVFRLQTENLNHIQSKRNNNFKQVFLKMSFDYKFLVISIIVICGGLAFFSIISSNLQVTYYNTFERLMDFRQSLIFENISQTNKIIDILIPTEEFRSYTLNKDQILVIGHYLSSANLIEINMKEKHYINYCSFPTLLQFPNCKTVLNSSFPQSYSMSLTLLDSIVTDFQKKRSS